MITLKGMTWDHARGYDPMIATSKEYSKKNSDIEILWDKRSLQAFADRPIELMAHDYDFIVIDHPHVGEASSKNLLYNFSLAKNYSNQLESLGVTAYNVSFNEDLIYLSTDQGLFLSEDGQFWEKFNSFIDYETGAQILSEIVYDAKVINNVIGHQPFGLELTIDESIHGFNNEVLVQKLKEGDPPIWTRVPAGAEYVSIHVFGLSDGEPEIVGQRLAELLS